jgi:acetyl esterase/lipase
MTKRTPALILLLFFAWPVSLEARVEKNVVYGMHSGLALLMDIHHPEKPTGYGVIFIGGSGWHMPLAANSMPLKDRAANTSFLKKLTEAGYTVFAINHRAAPRFRYPDAVEDAQRAVRFVRHHAKEYGVHPERIGGMGGSSGGHLVSMLATLDGAGNPEDLDPVNRQSAKLQCAVTAAAPSDLSKIKTEAGLSAVISFLGMPLRDTNPAAAESKRYTEASPVSHVSADDAPFLLLHGDADRTVPFEQAELMEAALRKAGVEVQLIRVPGGGHGVNFEGATNPPDFLGEMVRWLDRHLAVSTSDSGRR